MRKKAKTKSKSHIADLNVDSLKDIWRHRAEEEIHKDFQKIDVDRSGYIDLHELQQGLKKYGIKLSRQQTRKLMRQYDDDPDNKIEMREFIQLKRDIEADNFRHNRSTRRNMKRRSKKSRRKKR